MGVTTYDVLVRVLEWRTYTIEADTAEAAETHVVDKSPNDLPAPREVFVRSARIMRVTPSNG